MLVIILPENGARKNWWKEIKFLNNSPQTPFDCNFWTPDRRRLPVCAIIAPLSSTTMPGRGGRENFNSYRNFKNWGGEWEKYKAFSRNSTRSVFIEQIFHCCITLQGLFFIRCWSWLYSLSGSRLITQLLSLIPICWIVIYLVDSAVQCLTHRDLIFKTQLTNFKDI